MIWTMHTLNKDIKYMIRTLHPLNKDIKYDKDDAYS